MICKHILLMSSYQEIKSQTMLPKCSLLILRLLSGPVSQKGRHKVCFKSIKKKKCFFENLQSNHSLSV